jgi:transglutaminase-like putative cysteine protease
MTDADLRRLFALLERPVDPPPDFVESLLSDIDAVAAPTGVRPSQNGGVDLATEFDGPPPERAYFAEPMDASPVGSRWPRVRRRRVIGVLAAVAAVIVATVAVAVTGPSAHPRPSPVAPAQLPSSPASPLVDLNARLHQLSQQEVFTVQTDHPTYYRLTSLSTFSGSGWSLDDTYRPVASDLRAADTTTDALPPDPGPSTTVTATFHISALQSLWLPVPYRPVRVTGVGGLRWSAAAGSVITDKQTSNGLTYTVTSQVPDATPAQLRASPRVDTSDPALRKYTELPSNIDPRVRALAAQIVSGAHTPDDEALAIQNYLLGPLFHYSLDVPADQSQNALVDFLFNTRAGFSQQFAGAFTVLAREVGLPSRVAVGFTEGTKDGQGVYHVTDADAHAWPEVWFNGVGWVAFEPTPGFGNSKEAPTTASHLCALGFPIVGAGLMPNAGVADGQVVHVVGNGCAPGVTYTVAECAAKVAGWPPFGPCPITFTHSVIADATGAVSTYLKMQKVFPGVDCGVAPGCVVVLSREEANGSTSFESGGIPFGA